MLFVRIYFVIKFYCVLFQIKTLLVYYMILMVNQLPYNISLNVIRITRYSNNNKIVFSLFSKQIERNLYHWECIQAPPDNIPRRQLEQLPAINHLKIFVFNKRLILLFTKVTQYHTLKDSVRIGWLGSVSNLLPPPKLLAPFPRLIHTALNQTTISLSSSTITTRLTVRCVIIILPVTYTELSFLQAYKQNVFGYKIQGRVCGAQLEAMQVLVQADPKTNWICSHEVPSLHSKWTRKIRHTLTHRFVSYNDL